MEAGLLLACQLVRLQVPLQVPEPPLPADDVQWTAPPDCPDREVLLAGVARRRGRALAPGQVRVVARTTAPGPRSYRLDLQLDLGGRHEERVLTARTCAALVDAAALVIALAIDADPTASEQTTPEPTTPKLTTPKLTTPELTTPEPASPDPPVEPVAPPPSVAPPVVLDELAPAPPAAPVAPPRRGPGGFLRLQGLAEYGALPGPTGGVDLAGGLLWRRIRLELQASYLAPRTVTTPQGRVRASLVAGAVLGCARLGRGALELPLCAGLELGAMPGVADGPDLHATSAGRWFAALLGVGAIWRVHPRIGLSAALQGLAAIHRPTFVLRDPGPEVVLFDPGVVSGRLVLGIELRFGDPR